MLERRGGVVRCALGRCSAMYSAVRRLARYIRTERTIVFHLFVRDPAVAIRAPMTIQVLAQSRRAMGPVPHVLRVLRPCLSRWPFWCCWCIRAGSALVAALGCCEENSASRSLACARGGCVSLSRVVLRHVSGASAGVALSAFRFLGGLLRSRSLCWSSLASSGVCALSALSYLTSLGVCALICVEFSHLPAVSALFLC